MSGDRPAVWPRLNLGVHLWRGIGAVALFVVLAYVFARAPIGEAAGFPGDASITASIGYSIVGLEHLAGHEVESFLVALITIAVVLDAALDGAVMLARRDVGGRITSALRIGGEDE